MKWSEVIMVRSADPNVTILAKTVQNLMAAAVKSDGHEGLRVFCRENLETDYCIVLCHTGEKTDAGGSPLGLHIVAALKEVGMVHHTVWNEIEGSSD